MNCVECKFRMNFSKEYSIFKCFSAPDKHSYFIIIFFLNLSLGLNPFEQDYLKTTTVDQFKLADEVNFCHLPSYAL